MAQVLSEGFQRMKDFQKLEQQNRELEREIEERKQSEGQLRESEERYSRAISGTNDGLWDWPDTSSDETWWSPRLYSNSCVEVKSRKPDAAVI